MNQAEMQTYEWNTIDWTKVEKIVFKLQKRIYKAERSGNKKLVRQLQRLLLKSQSAKLLAVRRVTQDNQGKNTAGVDGVKSLAPNQRVKLVERLKLDGKAKPTRRVMIPKPGKDELRPLSIPIIEDRAKQALAKCVLEPEWEAKFEPSSHGFRPGRSCHDAIEDIFLAIKQKSKWVLDADIAKCFDKIDHSKLLEKLDTFPTLKRQIKAWLKSGFKQSSQWFPTNEGTPQGGVISPLLANIALHGMEETIKAYARTWKGHKRNNEKSVSVIRYADDFLVIHESRQVVEECQLILETWLQNIGLEFKALV